MDAAGVSRKELLCHADDRDQFRICFLTRECKPDNTSRGTVRLHRDRPAVRIHDQPCIIQTQPDICVDMMSDIAERFEQVLQCVFRESRTLIFYCDLLSGIPRFLLKPLMRLKIRSTSNCRTAWFSWFPYPVKQGIELWGSNLCDGQCTCGILKALDITGEINSSGRIGKELKYRKGIHRYSPCRFRN